MTRLAQMHSTSVILNPSSVILNPSLVILSAAKNLTPFRTGSVKPLSSLRSQWVRRTCGAIRILLGPETSATAQNAGPSSDFLLWREIFLQEILRSVYNLLRMTGFTLVILNAVKDLILRTGTVADLRLRMTTLLLATQDDTRAFS